MTCNAPKKHGGLPASYKPVEMLIHFAKEEVILMKGYEKAFFHGAASEVLTTFNTDGSINYSLLANQLEYLISEGIPALFLNGLASETLNLSNRERYDIAKFSIETIRHRVPVMVNVTQNHTSAGIEEAQTYECLGADAICIVSPAVYKLSEKSLFDYFSQVGNSVGIPAYIYNAPETGNKLSPALAAEIFLKNPNFHGYKDSTQSIIEQQTLLRLIGDRPFELICGSDAQTATTMMLGGIGVISLISVVFPQPIIDLCSACDSGDWELANERQTRVLRIREALKIGPFLAAYRFASEKTGVSLGYARKPFVQLSEAEKEKVEALLKAENLI